MKVLCINGSPNEHSCTDAALREVENTLHRHGIETERVYLGKKPVPGCIGCRKCKETGRCIQNDGVNQLLARLDEFDALVVGSPVYYAGPSGRPPLSWTGCFTPQAGGWPGNSARRWYPAGEAGRPRRLTG